MKRQVILLISVIFCSGIYAQQTLSLDSAISIVLKNNYNILVAQNNYKMASNSYSPGVAGMLPTLSLNGGASPTVYSESYNTIKQNYSTGLTLSKNGAVSSTLSPGLGLTWTLFDGTKMFIAYNELGLLRDEGVLTVKSTIQDNIASVIEAYYNIVQQKQLLAALDSNLAYDKEEMDIANKQFEVGTGSKLNYLQAEVSYNAQNSAYLKQEVSLTNATISLNQLLELPIETSYSVRDDINIGKELIYDSLKNTTSIQNPSLMLAKTGIKVAEDNVKETNAERLPTINLGLDYGFSRTQSNAGFALLNQSLGFSGGFGFSWTIFKGSIINIRHENAELAETNAKLQ